MVSFANNGSTAMGTMDFLVGNQLRGANNDLAQLFDYQSRVGY